MLSSLNEICAFPHRQLLSVWGLLTEGGGRELFGVCAHGDCSVLCQHRDERGTHQSVPVLTQKKGNVGHHITYGDTEDLKNGRRRERLLWCFHSKLDDPLTSVYYSSSAPKTSFGFVCWFVFDGWSSHLYSTFITLVPFFRRSCTALSSHSCCVCSHVVTRLEWNVQGSFLFPEQLIRCDTHPTTPNPISLSTPTFPLLKHSVVGSLQI